MRVKLLQSSLQPYGLTVARQAPLSMEFSRQEYWSGLQFLLQGIFPTQGSNLGSPALQADSLPSEPPGRILICTLPTLKGRENHESWCFQTQLLHWKAGVFLYPVDLSSLLNCPDSKIITFSI